MHFTYILNIDIDIAIFCEYRKYRINIVIRTVHVKTENKKINLSRNL